MTLYIVRHAVAKGKGSWRGTDAMRPLTQLGLKQAAAIADWFHRPVDIVVTSPTLRCLGTVLELAIRQQVDPVLRSDLLKDRPEAAAELVRQLLPTRAAVVCTHGEVIPGLLRTLRVQPVNSTRLDVCEKGSIWRIEPDADDEGQLVATYHTPAQIRPVLPIITNP